MSIPSTQKELKEILAKSINMLEAELRNIPADRTREQTVEGGISVCDVLAYQVGWSQLLIGWYESGKKGKMPEMPAPGYKWNQLGELAQHFYDTYHKTSYEELVELWKTAAKKIEKIVAENSDEKLYSLKTYNWTGDKWTLGRWINVNASSPYTSARTKIRKWKKEHAVK